MKRNENETFEEYCDRRKENNQIIKNKLKGNYIWYSKNIRNRHIQLNQGTFKNVNI